MAKTKIYELAKELNVSSKEVIGYLHEKGVEGKVAQSAIEDSMVSNVKNKFNPKPAHVPAQPSAQTQDAAHADAKKKKRIVIVGNPENSKTGMKIPPKKHEHVQKDIVASAAKPEPTQPVTPPPAPKHHVAGGTASADGTQPVRRTLDDLKVTMPTPKPRVQETPKPAPTTYSTDRPNNNRPNDGQQRQGGYNNNRPYNNNRTNDGQQRQGGYNNNRPNDGQQRQGGYNNNRPNDGQQRQGGYNNNRPYDSNRPQGGYNNNRPNDGQQRQGGYNNNRP
ncbi:MAG: translation initiation factor IF-2 N-terminal domain-containing protein, partial [Lachnospiraceae bacterium]